MPSDDSTWLITVPQDGDGEGIVQELASKLSQSSKPLSKRNVGELTIPSFKASS
jgi:V-type H+-transporting ATPase subunit C